MTKREAIDRQFLEVIDNVCRYEEFGSGRAEMQARVGGLLASGGSPTMHRDVPWLTDVFFRGIIGRQPDDGMEPKTSADGAAELRRTLDEVVACRRDDRLPELVRRADEQFRRLSADARQTALPSVQTAFRTVLRRLSGKGKSAAILAAWIGKHGPLPLASYRAWGEDELERAARNDGALQNLDAIRRKNRDRGLEVLHGLAVSVAYGMDRKGVGNIPALHVGGRVTREGDVIATGEDDFVNVNMVLDTLAMNAFLWFMDMREQDGRRAPSYGPMRTYLEGPATSRYLVGMVQDAVANQRGKVLNLSGTPQVRKESLDAPVDAEDSAAATRADFLPSAEGGRGETDAARFFRNVIKTLSPRLYEYFVLIRRGTPKMEALKAVGAKSAHFVEREAKALVAELAELKGEDYAELAKLVSGLMKGAAR